MDALLWDHSINEDAKEVPQGLKPEEEVNRFSVDEHLSEIERTNLFLTGGQLVQQRKAIEGLPGLLKGKGRAGWDATKDNLLLTLKQLDVAAQVSAAEGLRTAVQQHALPAADAAACLLPLAITNVRLKDKLEEESEAWLLLLLELVPVVGAEQLLDQVLPLALSHGEVNETVASRVVCCRLLGAMTPYLPPADVAACFASQLIAACQDTDYQVRIAAAEQLPVLARVLGPSATVDKLLPELSELLTDDEVQVRMSALNGLVALCQLVPREARVAHLLPLVRRHMQPLELELPLQRTLAAAFPRLLAAVHDDLEATDAGLMYSCFRHLAARTDVELRRTCAACVSELMVAPLPGSSPSYLHDTWTDLAADHDEQVRMAIAGQLHVMAKQVSPSDAARLLRRPLSALLRDTSPYVREALLAGLADTLQALATVDDLHREGLASDIHQGLMVLQGNIADNWRCQQHLASALPHLPTLLGPDVLAEQWAPYAFGLLLNGAAAVKPAAARGLASLLRSCRRDRPRTDLYCRTMRELAWGRSCFARLAFIQLCVAALAVFSCRWFKDHLLLAVMELLSDAVPNVRLVALGLLPALKQTIRLPEDVQQLEQLNSAMSNLMTDNDRDVAQAARGLHATFKRTPLRMTGGAGLLDLIGSASGAGGAEFEAADRAKEDGEAELAMVQEDLDRLTAEWAAVVAERKGRRNPMLALTEGNSSSACTPAGRLGAAKAAPSSAGGSGSGSISKALGSSQAALAGNSICSGSNFAGTIGAGKGAAAGIAGSGSTASGGWGAASGSSYDRRYGSGAASSSNSPGGTGASARAGVLANPATSTPSSLARATGRLATSSSSSSLGSPRPGNLSTAVNTSPTGGSAFGPGSPQSPTGSTLLAHMRLPVLAGSLKSGAGNGSSTSQGSSGSSSSSSSSSSAGSTAALMAGSRLAGWTSGLGSLGSPSATAAAAASRAQPGSLRSVATGSSTRTGSTSNSSLFGRDGSKVSSSATSVSSRPGGLQSKGGTGAFGGSAAAGSKGGAAGKGLAGTAAGAAAQASRDAARRFRS